MIRRYNKLVKSSSYKLFALTALLIFSVYGLSFFQKEEIIVNAQEYTGTCSIDLKVISDVSPSFASEYQYLEENLESVIEMINLVRPADMEYEGTVDINTSLQYADEVGGDYFKSFTINGESASARCIKFPDMGNLTDKGDSYPDISVTGEGNAICARGPGEDWGLASYYEMNNWYTTNDEDAYVLLFMGDNIPIGDRPSEAQRSDAYPFTVDNNFCLLDVSRACWPYEADYSSWDNQYDGFGDEINIVKSNLIDIALEKNIFLFGGFSEDSDEYPSSLNNYGESDQNDILELMNEITTPTGGYAFNYNNDLSLLQQEIINIVDNVCVATQPYCGDGSVDEGEECDDGNTDDDDGCSSSCEWEYLSWFETKNGDIYSSLGIEQPFHGSSANVLSSYGCFLREGYDYKVWAGCSNKAITTAGIPDNENWYLHLENETWETSFENQFTEIKNNLDTIFGEYSSMEPGVGDIYYYKDPNSITTPISGNKVYYFTEDLTISENLVYSNNGDVCDAEKNCSLLVVVDGDVTITSEVNHIDAFIIASGQIITTSKKEDGITGSDSVLLDGSTDSDISIGASDEDGTYEYRRGINLETLQSIRDIGPASSSTFPYGNSNCNNLCDSSKHEYCIALKDTIMSDNPYVCGYNFLEAIYDSEGSDNYGLSINFYYDGESTVTIGNDDAEGSWSVDDAAYISIRKSDSSTEAFWSHSFMEQTSTICGTTVITSDEVDLTDLFTGSGFYTLELRLYDVCGDSFSSSAKLSLRVGEESFWFDEKLTVNGSLVALGGESLDLSTESAIEFHRQNVLSDEPTEFIEYDPRYLDTYGSILGDWGSIKFRESGAE